MGNNRRSLIMSFTFFTIMFLQPTKRIHTVQFGTEYSFIYGYFLDKHFQNKALSVVEVNDNVWSSV